jgi:mannose-1-phosphate guanylyltransferase
VSTPVAPLYAVILAGGIGSRFWPLSTPERPKQLLPLIGQSSMLAETVARLEPLVGISRVLVLTSRALAPAVRRELPALAADQVLEEPRPAGTAAALAWASHEVARRGGADARLVSVHADSAIGSDERFRAVLQAASDAAAHASALATVGIVPTHPNPGLGYIQPGDPIGAEARRVVRFVEKPDSARAERMVADGYLWNSGIFAWRATDYLAEIAALTPEVAPALAHVSEGADAFFDAVPQPISVDVGVMERSGRVVVLPGDFGWDDVGTWGALRRLRRGDAEGNAVHGRTHLREARNNVVHSERGTVVLYGVEDLVVVVRDGVTLVTTNRHSEDLKALVDSLPPDVRELSALGEDARPMTPGSTR